MTREEKIAYMKKWRLKNRKHIREQYRKYTKAHPDMMREIKRKYYHKNKRLAMLALGGDKCIYCGCDVLKILEVNHVNSDGYEDRKSNKSLQGEKLFRYIIKKRIDTTRLNVTCRVCNALHDVRHRLKIHGHEVVWKAALDNKTRGQQ